MKAFALDMHDGDRITLIREGGDIVIEVAVGFGIVPRSMAGARVAVEFAEDAIADGVDLVARDLLASCRKAAGG